MLTFNSGNIVSTFQAGTFFGALLTFPLGERFGRKRAIMFACTVFLIGGTIMAGCPTPMSVGYVADCCRQRQWAIYP